MSEEPKKNCRACAHCYLEPDSPYFICGAVNDPWGRHIHQDLEHCDGGKLFQQHPGRNSDGTLKGGSR